MNLREVQRLQEEVRRQTREAERAEGALSQLLKSLREVHGLDSLEDAEREIASLEARMIEMERDLEPDLEAFKEKWGDLL